MTTYTLVRLDADKDLIKQATYASISFEAWAIDTRQGYDLSREDRALMATYRDIKTEHAWRGYCYAALTAQALPAAGRCDECGKGQPEGWALYCVDCLEKTGLLAKEALPNAQHVSSTAADLTGPNDTAAQAPTLTDHEIETLAHRMCWRYKHDGDSYGDPAYTFNSLTLLDFVRKIKGADTQ